MSFWFFIMGLYYGEASIHDGKHYPYNHRNLQSCETHCHQSASRFWPPRGGDNTVEDISSEEPNRERMTTVGVLNLLPKESVLKSSDWLWGSSGGEGMCLLFKNTINPRITKTIDAPTVCIGGLPSVNNPILAETLALICDVIVILIDPNSINDMTRIQSVVKGLVDGANKRRRALTTADALHSDRSLVVVVVPSVQGNDESRSSDNTMLESSKDVLIQTIFATITPTTYERFDVMTWSELKEQWNRMVMQWTHHDEPTVLSAIKDTRVFPQFLQRVYHSLGGKGHFQDPTMIDEPRKEGDREQTQDNPVSSAPTTGSESRPTTSQPRRRHHITHDSALDVIPQVLATAQTQMDALEQMMDQIWLDDDKSVPMLDFGVRANVILDSARQRLANVPDAMRIQILIQLATKLRVLYQRHLESLRNYFGRRYEIALDADGSTEQDWTQAAAHMTEGFRAAAQHAIPELCRPGNELRDSDFEYVVQLQGLISDMMEATQLRRDEESLALGDEDDDVEGTVRRPAKWYEKLAARALVLGINYLQGWMAWEAIKRAAIERDRNMPKFPLF